MNKKILDIYNLIQELSWYFGNQGFDGECCGDLTLVEFTALKKAREKENIGIQEMGNTLNITKSGASKIIDRLTKKGYVVRESCSVDGRVCCVATTDKGMEAISQIEERYTKYVAEMLKDIDNVNIDNVRDVLEWLVASVRKKGFIKQN